MCDGLVLIVEQNGGLERKMPKGLILGEDVWLVMIKAGVVLDVIGGREGEL